jgi:hypothetical protein
MDFPEAYNMKAPKGLAVPFGAFGAFQYSWRSKRVNRGFELVNIIPF